MARTEVRGGQILDASVNLSSGAGQDVNGILPVINGGNGQSTILRLDQMAAPTAAVALGAQKITGLANGASAQDAITKAQLDAVGVSTRPVVIKLTGSTTTSTLTTYVALTSGSGVVFVAPPSGMVKVSMSIICKNGTSSRAAYCGIEVRAGSTIGTGTVFLAPDEMISNFNLDYIRVGATELVTGLTSGSTYNIRAMFASSFAGATATAARATIIAEPCL